MPLWSWFTRPRNKGGQHGEVCGGDASGDAIVCYHQTSPENAQAILQSGRMKRGPKGFGGRGIYFAEDPQATSCKANHKGVILECVVSLGRVKPVHRAGDWGGRWRQLLFRYDSIALTFLEGGIEYVVFDPTRVLSVKVHKVLVTSTSTGGLSTDGGSSFIGTAVDPGCCSSSCGQSSSSSSSGSSVSGDGTDAGTEECLAACSSQLATHLQQHPDAAPLPQPSCSASNGTGPNPSSCSQNRNDDSSSSNRPEQSGCYCSSGGTSSSGTLPCSLGGSGPKQRQQHKCSTRCPPQPQPFGSCRHSSAGGQQAASVAAHMVVLLEDHQQQATCSKQLAAGGPDCACRQLVGA